MIVIDGVLHVDLASRTVAEAIPYCNVRLVSRGLVTSLTKLTFLLFSIEMSISTCAHQHVLICTWDHEIDVPDRWRNSELMTKLNELYYGTVL